MRRVRLLSHEAAAALDAIELSIRDSCLRTDSSRRAPNARLSSSADSTAMSRSWPRRSSVWPAQRVRSAHDRGVAQAGGRGSRAGKVDVLQDTGKKIAHVVQIESNPFDIGIESATVQSRPPTGAQVLSGLSP